MIFRIENIRHTKKIIEARREWKGGERKGIKKLKNKVNPKEFGF